MPSQCVPVADLGRTALEYVPAPIMGLAILLIDPASATLDGSVVTALSVSTTFFFPFNFRTKIRVLLLKLLGFFGKETLS